MSYRWVIESGLREGCGGKLDNILRFFNQTRETSFDQSNFRSGVWDDTFSCLGKPFSWHAPIQGPWFGGVLQVVGDLTNQVLPSPFGEGTKETGEMAICLYLYPPLCGVAGAPDEWRTGTVVPCCQAVLSHPFDGVLSFCS